MRHYISLLQQLNGYPSLCSKCDYDGVNLLNASDVSAGQSVPHFHIHLIPRK